MAGEVQRRAHRRIGDGPGYLEGRGEAGLAWACTLEGLLVFFIFLPKGLGRQHLGSLLVGRLLGSELGPCWVLVCVCVYLCQMLCDMARVLELRLILRQPSPLWVSFTVEELQIYQQGPKVSDQLRAVGWPFP